jgi:hypothetical protein
MSLSLILICVALLLATGAGAVALHRDATRLVYGASMAWVISQGNGRVQRVTRPNCYQVATAWSIAAAAAASSLSNRCA